MTTIEIIRDITSSKEREKRHPTFALFTEIHRASSLTKEGLKSELRDLVEWEQLRWGNTINDTYFIDQQNQ